MKLTPLDIHHKEFRHSLRGYAEDEVDQFLDEVADEFERLFKENIDLSERLEAASAKVREFEMKENAVNSAIISAQTAGEEMRRKAQVEADSVLRDAEIKAKEIIHNALARKQQVAAELRADQAGRGGVPREVLGPARAAAACGQRGGAARGRDGAARRHG